MSPRLSVVLSTLGNHAGLRARARRLRDSGRRSRGSFEVLVVADRAEPDPAAVEAAIGERDYPVRLLRGEIPGLSANRNAGWRAAEAPLVLFTDNDTIPEPRLVAEHLAWHAREPALRGGGARPRALGAGGAGDAVHALARPRDPVRLPGDRGHRGRLGALLRRQRVGQARARRAGRRLRRGPSALRLRGPRLRLPRRTRSGLRLLYNRDAVVQHLRAYDLPFYKRRVRRLAHAERSFVAKHPELEPWFFRMFSHAARLPRASGRGRHLIRFVPRSTPLIGAARLAQRRPLLPSGAGAGLPRRLGGGRGGEPVAARLPAGRSSRSAAPERPPRPRTAAGRA